MLSDSVRCYKYETENVLALCLLSILPVGWWEAPRGEEILADDAWGTVS